MSILRKTQSLCPECLRVLDAHYVTQENEQHSWVYLQKTCPEHGFFSAPIWVDLPDTPTFSQWFPHTAPPNYPERPLTPVQHGCPYDCGLCAEHAQHTCCALLEVTQRCNMHCPICYASANDYNTASTDDPTLQELEVRLEQLMHHAGAVNVQLSGGEPTMRDDLPQIITLTKNKGFSFVQLNTNGLRLGQDPAYAYTLKEAGLSLVYLQWDDMRDASYRILRGKPCLQIKEDALKHCLAAGLSVVFVVTLVKGVNDTALGDLLQKALNSGPLVRGIHIQPVSSFGRYPWNCAENAEHTDALSPRITIPEVLHALEVQSQGMIKAAHFQPPNSEHALCSFNAVYTRNKDTLQLCKSSGGCCSHAPFTTLESGSSPSAAKKAQEFVAQHWGPINTCTSSVPPATLSPAPLASQQDFDTVLQQIQHRFTISGMAFQDAYTLDLERLRRCHIHIMSEKNTIVPFCAYNLTSNQGFSLYRGAHKHSKDR